MPRNQDRPTPDRVVITLPMPTALLARIDREVEADRRRRPHQYVSRSGTIRQLVAEALDRDRVAATTIRQRTRGPR